jgi:hypothetical protein
MFGIMKTTVSAWKSAMAFAVAAQKLDDDDFNTNETLLKGIKKEMGV